MGRNLCRVLVCLALILPLVAAIQVRAETLEDALAAAYQNNPGLQAERAKLRAADEQVPQALSGWRPDIEATAEAGRISQTVSHEVGVLRPGDITPRDASLNITQPVFNGFRTVSKVRSAEAAVRAQRAALTYQEQKLLLDAAEAYLDLVQAQRVLDTNREQESVLQKELDEIQARQKIGESSKTDVSQALARLKSAQVALLEAEGTLARQRTTYERVIGRKPLSPLEQPDLTIEVPKTQGEATDLALQNNPAVIAADYGEQAAQADIASAKGSLLPQVSVVGSLSDSREQSAISPAHERVAKILTRVSVPLYRSGADYSKTRAAQQTANQKSLELADTRDKVREDALNSWQSLMTVRAAREGQKDVIAAATDALEGVKTEMNGGIRTTLDVLNAERELLDDKVTLVKYEHDEAMAVLELAASMGTLTAEALHLPVQLYDPDKHYETVRNKWVGFSNEQQ